MKRRLVLLALISLAGCSREPQTELTRKMEKLGAGDLRHVTSQSIEQWFLRNPDVAVEISRTCRSLRSNAPAKWGDTTDGRICAAASKVHVFYYRLRPVDGMTFDAGR
jgi:hypothetical protein